MCANTSEIIDPHHGPWNPGITSDLPRNRLRLATIFRPENVATSFEQALELADFTGLPPHHLVAFRPERLILHELLIRVTADLEVPDGPNYEDLGINFRRIADTILTEAIEPHIAELTDTFTAIRREATAFVSKELNDQLNPEPRQEPPARFRLLGLNLPAPPIFSRPAATQARHREERDINTARYWQHCADTTEPSLHQSCYQALARVATTVIAKHGRLTGDHQLLTDLALTFISNTYGSDQLGEAIAPHIADAAKKKGYRFLPPQQNPIVMNVKGASASGKSTIRPLQRKLAERLAIPWQDFALISPDIWRKRMLDYQSLGPDYKYAGAFTGHELEVIDKKLDRYMVSKASTGRMTHLLIDRFRFDSFLPESEVDEASKLLTRFGDLVYMFFMITPPEATVERAWLRGLKFGRYKAVDDLLAHNVEAYTGMPELFFTWALRKKKRVHYEFLDNSVPEGHLPRTVAFGWNGEMNILDLTAILNIERFRNININATRPEDVYAATKLNAADNLGFLRKCAQMIPIINFADHDSGAIYARLEKGTWTWQDPTRCHEILNGTDTDTRTALQALSLQPDSSEPNPPRQKMLEKTTAHTVGAWGASSTDAPT